MNDSKILELARQAGLVIECGQVRSSGCPFVLQLDIERFARLVAEAEREACAAICDEAAEFHANAGDMRAAVVDQNRAEDIRSRTE